MVTPSTERDLERMHQEIMEVSYYSIRWIPLLENVSLLQPSPLVDVPMIASDSAVVDLESGNDDGE